MPSDAEETQLINVTYALEEFVKILIKEYPLAFKEGSSRIKINCFPYEASLQIKKKKSDADSLPKKKDKGEKQNLSF
jgi:hypothetical protein